MRILKRSVIAIAAAVATVSGSVAQDTETATTFGAWTIVCAEPGEDGAQLCELRQIVGNQQGQEVTRLAFGAAREGGRELAIRTPQGVLVQSPVEVAPLEAEAQITVPYRTCLNRVCIARALVEDAQIEPLFDATQPAVRFVDRSRRQIRVIFSVDGLADGLAALDAR